MYVIGSASRTGSFIRAEEILVRLERKLIGPHSQSRSCGEKKHSLPLPPSSSNLVAIPTELPQLHLTIQNELSSIQADVNMKITFVYI
jgi:hypothetical protein